MRDLAYADHEFVNFRILTRVADSAGQQTTRQAEYFIDDQVLNLDNDELGMLSWLDASLSVSVSGFSQDQDSNGAALATAEIGANLSEADLLGGDVGFDSVDEMELDPDVETTAGFANDEPGLWSVLNAASTGGFKDLSGDGGYYAGNSVPDNDRQRREYYAETMSGPYIDSTDDIMVGISVEKDSMGAEVQLEVTGQMSFVIFEYDQRRAEFGPVPGGT